MTEHSVVRLKKVEPWKTVVRAGFMRDLATANKDFLAATDPTFAEDFKNFVSAYKNTAKIKNDPALDAYLIERTVPKSTDPAHAHDRYIGVGSIVRGAMIGVQGSEVAPFQAAHVKYWLSPNEELSDEGHKQILNGLLYDSLPDTKTIATVSAEATYTPRGLLLSNEFGLERVFDNPISLQVDNDRYNVANAGNPVYLFADRNTRARLLDVHIA